MKHIKITCLLCKQDYTLLSDEICTPCFFKEINKHNVLIKKESPEKKFWKNAKEASLWMIIYTPIAIFIAFQFGFGYEMAWIGGGIFIQVLPIIHEWLLSKM